MKRFLASLLGVVVFFLLVPTCVILVARDLTSEKTIGKILDVSPQLFGEEYEDQGFGESIIKEIEDIDPKYAECFDEKELEEITAKVLAQALRNMGDSKVEYLIDTTEITEYVIKATEEYADEIGEELPEDFKEQLTEYIDGIGGWSRDELIGDDEEVLVIFEVVYSNSILITLIAGMALCIVLMFILLGNIKDTLSKAKTPFMVNGILIVLLGSGVSALLKSGELNGAPVPLDLISTVTFPFYKIGAISIVISVILIVVSKVLTHNKSISNSNDAIENLGNTTYIPNNNITNTPYNGYQNH